MRPNSWAITGASIGVDFAEASVHVFGKDNQAPASVDLIWTGWRQAGARSSDDCCGRKRQAMSRVGGGNEGRKSEECSL